MTLAELLESFAVVDKDVAISGLTLDSRTVVSGHVFIALAGTRQHGLMHVEQAIARGASAIVYDPDAQGWQLAAQVRKMPVIAIENLAWKLGGIAARFYGDPSVAMKVIGITGTNGKTSCSQFLGQMLNDCGIIGTLGWGEWGRLRKTLNTTPDALAVQAILAALLTDNKHTVAMEVSSHGLEQGRVNGVHFKAAVFTNISRDHLDYHGSMEAYVQAKLSLLQKPGLAFAVVNLDDAYSEQILAAAPPSVVQWGFSVQGRQPASVQCVLADDIQHQLDGIEFTVRWQGERQRIKVPLFGDFNIENSLAVLSVMLAMGVALAEAARRLAQVKPVTGRMERFEGKAGPMVFVDYAHTPDALQKVLSSLKRHCRQALWVVFGCGGNRDAGKRPQMGCIAEHWAEHVIVTDDNPRFENGLTIVQDILAGCRSGRIEVIENREQAIHSAITRADGNDCIVIAGKGHEQYQEINGVKLPFSDSQVVIEALKMRAEHE
jgi:UDP-N-acetylmuramoyl-L-alanyl-D-glutamate--2,6-diaminopimelate ligase